jgi:SAM-dependent methyltransferase
MLAVALPLRDILEQRVESAEEPAWCRQRGWGPFLASLSEPELEACEAQGLARLLPSLSRAPHDLGDLARAVLAATELPRLSEPASAALSGEALRSVRLRKRAQLAGLLSAVQPLAEAAERVVDVGAGSGHFTRLSAELFERESIGLEHNPARVESARLRSADAKLVSFVTLDARQAIQLLPQDLAVGLHACGELGDRLVEQAAEARCGLALVSCCLQKISSPARPSLTPEAASLELRRECLGLTNLTAQPQGVETRIEATMAARQARYALGRLLRARGIAVEPGAEMAGINRRQANAGLPRLAEKALALRGLAPASTAELAQHEVEGAVEYQRIRRWSLPRNMLSRLVEVLVSLDRASHLEQRGLSVQVALAFDRAVSPRNIAIFASSAAERLPAAHLPRSC